MKKTFTIILLFITHFSFAQNLVPNWSFEDTVSCPNSFNEMDLAKGWSSFRPSPDYFNSCDNAGDVGVPSNVFGYQYAKTGNAYAGFATFAYEQNTREHLGTQLNQQLVIGQKYFVSFFVSRAVNILGAGDDEASNKIGARFSTVSYNGVYPSPIDNYAQVYTDSVITDTLNWVKISGSFIADSAYSYLIIGNFFTDSATTHIVYDSSAQIAYYFIDDVIVSSDSLFTGISESHSFNLIKIIPNPARDAIAIWGNDIQSLSLHDVLGRMVYSLNSDVISPAIINTSSFPRGIYFIEAKTKSEVIDKEIILQ